MKSSKFKGFLLFVVGFFALIFGANNVLAGSYQFGLKAYVCEGESTVANLTACKNKLYSNELSEVDPNQEVTPGTSIMVVMTYTHDFYEYYDSSSDEYFMKGASTLNMILNFDTSVVEPIVLSVTSTGFPPTTTTYNGILPANDSNNPAFAMIASSPSLSSWTYDGSVDNNALAIVVADPSLQNTLVYNGGPFVTTFFKVKSNAPEGATFSFTYDTTSANPTNLANPDMDAVDFTAGSGLTLKTPGGATQSTDRTLKSFTAKGNNNLTYPIYKNNTYTTPFSPSEEVYDYYMVVPDSLTSLTLDAEVTEEHAKFNLSNATTMSETFNIPNTGENTITFFVSAEDLTVGQVTYRVKVYKLSTVATLQTLATTGNVTLSGFASGTYTYSPSTTYQTLSTNVNAKPTHANAFITDTSDVVWTKNGSGVYSQSFALPNYGSTVNTKVLKVQAEDCLAKYSSVPGNTCHYKDYTINVSRENPSHDATLKSLKMSGSEIFQTGKTSYDQGIVPYSTASVNVSAQANSTLATVVSSTVGNKSLNVGDTTLTVTVKAEDCLVLSGSTPQPECTTQNYTIKYHRRDNDAYLKSLSVTGTNVSMAAFLPDTVNYTVYYPSGATSVHIEAERNHTTSTLNVPVLETDGIDYTDLTTNYPIIVTAEDGNQKTYTLTFSKVLDKNAKLDDLSVSGVTLDPKTFSSSTYSYMGVVDGNVEKVTVYATLHDDTKQSFITETVDGVDYYYGPREVNLDYGTNVIYVKVQAEDPEISQPYTITITRNRKSIKTLKEISVDGTPITGFDPTTLEYTAPTVPYDTTQVTVAAVVADNSDATYTVLNQQGGVAAGGVINLNTGDNNVTIRVRAMDGTTGDYTLTIPRTKNNDASISSVTFFGQPATCNASTRKCTITVANENVDLSPTDVVVNTTDPVARATKPTTTIPLVVNKPSDPKTTSYIFTVTAENDTTTAEYEVTITREADDDATLREVTVLTNEGRTYHCTTFNNYACTISVPSTTTSYTLTAAPTKSTSTYTGNDTFPMGGTEDSSQLKTLTVYAESGKSQTYQIRIERGKSTNANLSTITIDGVEVDGFDGVHKQNYSVTVPGTTSSIALGAAVADTGKATIENESTALGRKDLVYGANANVYTIKVIAEAGGDAVKTYTVTVTRSNNIDPSLSNIQIDGTNLTGFVTDTYLYDYNSSYYQSLENNPLVVPYNTTAIKVVGFPTDATYGTVKYNGQTLGVSDKITLQTGLNTIIVTGIAHNTSITRDYTLKVYRSLNTNNSIAELVVAGKTAQWDAENNRYTVTVPNTVTNVGPLNVNVTLPSRMLESDPEATVNIPTMDLVTTNVNNYQVTVTSEAGEAKTYPVVITREKSKINTLEALAVTNGAFNPSFKSDTNEYTVIVPATTTEFNVTYRKTDETAEVSGAGRITMTEANMTVNVSVQSEDPNIEPNVYVLHVERSGDSVLTLSSITVNSGEQLFELDPLFSPDKTSYTVEVPGTISQINIDAVATDQVNNPSISGTGIKNVSKAGNGTTNVFTIKCYSSADKFINYTVNVVVLDKTINTLEELHTYLADGTELVLSPEFDSAKTSYVLPDQVYDVTTLHVKAKRTDVDSTVKINGTTYTLSNENDNVEIPVSLNTGANTITVAVKSQAGITKNYDIRVNRAKNDDTTLKQLNVSGGVLDPTFKPNVKSYSVELDSDVATLSPSEVTAIATDSNATVIKDPTVTIADDGSTNYNILVTAENGDTATYTINVTRKKSTETKLSRVELTGGSIGTFTPNNTSYTLTVAKTASEFTIKGIPVDTKATVTYNGATATAEDGTYTFPADIETVVIKVTAEDGVANRDYTFNVITADATDNTLASLEVVAYSITPNFAPTTTVYDIGDVGFGTTALTINATPTNPHATINYYVDGTKQDSKIVQLPQTLGTKSITVEVIPATGVTSQALRYSILYDMVTSRNNYLATLVPSTGTDDFGTFTKTKTAYEITVPYETTSISFQMTTEDPYASVSDDGGSNYSFAPTGNPVTYTFEANDDPALSKLKVGINTYTFTVKSAAGSTRNYVVTVTRNSKTPSSDVYLSGLSVDSYTYLGTTYSAPLDPVFNKDTEDYNIGAIPYSVPTLTVRANPNYAGQRITYTLNGNTVEKNEDGSATIDVSNTTGSNLIVAHVTAENGVATKNYQISYTKTPSTNANLSLLRDGMNKITNFNKDTLEYEIDVDATVNTLTLTIQTEDPNAKITIGNQTRVNQWSYEASGLVGGPNNIVIKVTAENNNTKTYKLTINKAGVSELITSRGFGHKIEDGMIKTAILNETVYALLNNELDNDIAKLQIWDKDETTELNKTSATTVKVATGQVVKLINPSTGEILDSKIVVVKGDVDGNGTVNVLDTIPIVNHSLRRSTITGVYAVAADVDGNGTINVLDTIPIVNHSLRRTLIDYTIRN